MMHNEVTWELRADVNLGNESKLCNLNVFFLYSQIRKCELKYSCSKLFC